MIRIPPFTHSIRYTRPTVHRGVCPRKPQSEAGRILRIPRYDKPKIEKPKKIGIYCPGEGFSWNGQLQVHSASANDNNWLS